MTLLDTIQTLSAGPLGWGTLIGSVALLVRATATALEKRAEAQRLAAHADDVTAQTVRTFMDEMRGKVGRLEEDLARCHDGRAEIEAENAELRGLVEVLRTEVQDLRALISDAKADSIVKAAVGNVASIESVQRARKDRR